MAEIRRLSSSPSYEPVFAHNSSLGGDESELLGKMHEVVRRSRSKMDDLRKENKQKDRVIEREHSMRRAAERRELPDAGDDSMFIDMYAGSTPSVQEELRARLDPATQRANLLRGMRPDRPSPNKDTHKQEARQLPQVKKSPKVDQPKHDGDSKENISESLQTSDDCNTEESSVYRDRNRKPKKGRRYRDSDDSYWDEREERYRHPRHGTMGSHPSSGTWFNERMPYQPHPGMHIPWLSPQQFTPGMVPASYDPRLLHASPMVLQTATSLPGSIPTTTLTGVPQGMAVGPNGTEAAPQGMPMVNAASQSLPDLSVSYQQSPTHTTGQASPQQSHQLTQQYELQSPQHQNRQGQHESRNTNQGTQHNGNYGSEGVRNIQNPHVTWSERRDAETKETDASQLRSRSRISKHQSETGVAASLDFREGVPLLITELGTAKDINQDLAERLAEAETEVESLKLALNVTEATLDAQVAAKGSAVVEEIYSAQKERDGAVLRRLRIANDERDDALARTKRYEHDFDSGTEVGSMDGDFDLSSNNATIHDLLAMLSQAETGPEIDRYGSAIVQRLGLSKNSKRRITSEEMRAIIQEKDAALIKCKRLEREIIEVRRNNEGLAIKSGNDKSVKAQLDATRRERDTALAQMKKLQEELDSVKIYYSLHKSLSQEANLRDQFNNTLGSIEEQVKARDQVLAKTQQDNSQLAQQLKAVHDDRNNMAVRLQQSEQSQRQMHEKSQQMERLIVVLRKKVTEGTIKTIL